MTDKYLIVRRPLTLPSRFGKGKAELCLGVARTFGHEMNHRGPLFSQILAEQRQTLQNCSIPDTHAILFMQGGATAGCGGAYESGDKGKADYIVAATSRR